MDLQSILMLVRFIFSKIHIYLRNLREIQQKYHKYKKKDTLGRNWKEKNLKCTINHIAIANSFCD